MFSNTIAKALENEWPMLVIILVIIISIRIAYIRTHTKEFTFYKEVLGLIFVIYMLLLFEMVTNNENASSGLNLIPFTEIFRHSLSSKLFYYNVIGNIVVFLPFGYFVSAIVKFKKVGGILLITLITSLTIELVQLRIGRAFDIDDIILNCVGGLAGFLIYIALSAIKKHLPKIFQKDFLYNIICFILLILIILYFVRVMGFNLW